MSGYVKQAKFNMGAEGVQLVARSALDKEKILGAKNPLSGFLPNCLSLFKQYLG